ncbi:hypothetical protein SAMN02745150_01306 [Brevinema andersonii]|uniref:Uncharacterized protein n=1 Tax=Brevinema andersonii TaxID=34097 RepID=A0A1I1F347_BREAD|nr:hypothetical protein [Brevinema andersonii]SFB91590.1 hypothetical protein SAMN02745150_01306 [Brevinema andersonii]
MKKYILIFSCSNRGLIPYINIINISKKSENRIIAPYVTVFTRIVGPSYFSIRESLYGSSQGVSVSGLEFTFGRKVFSMLMLGLLQGSIPQTSLIGNKFPITGKNRGNSPFFNGLKLLLVIVISIHVPTAWSKLTGNFNRNIREEKFQRTGKDLKISTM